MSVPPVIPPSRWGRDHWSTFAYVETCCVDHGGRLAIRRMRCHPRVHRLLAHEGSGGHCPPTRLADGAEVERHDDWSCVEDAVAADLLSMDDEGAVTRTRPKSPRFTLTSRGLQVAASLRAHLAAGGATETFRWVESAESVEPEVANA